MKFIVSNSYVIVFFCFIFINSKENFGKADSIIKRETIASNIKTNNNRELHTKSKPDKSQIANYTILINATKHTIKRNITAKLGEKIIKTSYTNETINYLNTTILNNIINQTIIHGDVIYLINTHNKTVLNGNITVSNDINTNKFKQTKPIFTPSKPNDTALNKILIKSNIQRSLIPPVDLNERLQKLIERLNLKNKSESLYPYIQTIRVAKTVYLVLQDKSRI